MSKRAFGGSRVLTLAVAFMSPLPLAGGSLRASRPSDPSAGTVICRTSDAAPSPGASSGAIPDERHDAERTFMAENEAAMRRMMDAMAISPTGDVDRDFVAMMVPHHQAAIEMAMAELRHGRNEQLRRIAQEIIVTQGQEIRVMDQAVDRNRQLEDAE